MENSIKLWLKEVEDLKNRNIHLFKSKEENKKEIQDFILKLFFKCDNEERECNFDHNTVQNF